MTSSHATSGSPAGGAHTAGPPDRFPRRAWERGSCYHDCNCGRRTSSSLQDCIMFLSSHSLHRRVAGCLIVATLAATRLTAAELPDPAKVETVKVLEVPSYCQGVVFDHAAKGYNPWGKSHPQFPLDGKHRVWAETGAPNGHKILADGSHLVCDASHPAVLHLDSDGKMLEPASKECDGKPLLGPNDLTLDTKNG